MSVNEVDDESDFPGYQDHSYIQTRLPPGHGQWNKAGRMRFLGPLNEVVFDTVFVNIRLKV